MYLGKGEIVYPSGFRQLDKKSSFLSKETQLLIILLIMGFMINLN